MPAVFYSLLQKLFPSQRRSCLSNLGRSHFACMRCLSGTIYICIYIYNIYIACEHECIAHDFCCLLCFWLTVSGWVYRSKHTPVTLAVNAGFAYPLVLFKQDTVYTLIFHTEQRTRHMLHTMITIFQELEYIPPLSIGERSRKVMAELEPKVIWGQGKRVTASFLTLCQRPAECRRFGSLG